MVWRYSALHPAAPAPKKLRAPEHVHGSPTGCRGVSPAHPSPSSYGVAGPIF
jgi:hypothetical protein